MFGAAAFHSSLSQELSSRLELQQKRVLAIILGSQYRNYSHALQLTALPRLDTLREEACLKWALRSQSHPKHSDLFPLNQSTVNTRFRNKFKEYFCHSAKFYNSAMHPQHDKVTQKESCLQNQSALQLKSIVLLFVAVKDGVLASSLVESPDSRLITVVDYNKHH